MDCEEEPANLYPIALDLRGRLCVIVGGGAVAARKAEGLAAVGAHITVVDPNPDIVCRQYHEHVIAPFKPTHLDGAFLVIAATDDPAVNQAVAVAAREQRILINQAASASIQADGDFVTMATVRRGELLVGITTGGAGPAVSARLRSEIDARFGPEWTDYVALLREMRALSKEQIPDRQHRIEALRRLSINDNVRMALREGNADEARREAIACLS